MSQANIHFITALLDPLVGAADDDQEVVRYRDVDADDEAQIRQVVRDRLLPHLQRFDADNRCLAERSLRYFLSKEGTDFTRLYDASLLPIAAPSNARQFFVWLCEELFGKEPAVPLDLGEIRENNDIHGPNSIRLAPVDDP